MFIYLLIDHVAYFYFRSRTSQIHLLTCVSHLRRTGMMMGPTLAVLPRRGDPGPDAVSLKSVTDGSETRM